MMMTYEASTKIIYWKTEDQSTTHNGYQRSLLSSLTDGPFNAYFSVDLTSNKFTGGGLVRDGNGANILTTADGLNYGSDWVFDSSLVVSVCSDYDGTDSIGCKIRNLKVFYSFYGDVTTIDYGNSVTVIGDYKLNEGKGTTLKNSQGTLSSATLSATPPIWTPVTNITLQKFIN